MLRQHQFEKVEMVSIARPEDSRAELDRMTALRRGHPGGAGPALPHRGARRPATWASAPAGPTTSRSGCRGRTPTARSRRCSVCGDFQARRMNARFRRGEGAKPRVRPHAQRLRPRGRPHADRGAGERPGGGRLGHAAAGARALPRRRHPRRRGRNRGRLKATWNRAPSRNHEDPVKAPDTPR